MHNHDYSLHWHHCAPTPTLENLLNPANAWNSLCLNDSSFIWIDAFTFHLNSQKPSLHVHLFIQKWIWVHHKCTWIATFGARHFPLRKKSKCNSAKCGGGLMSHFAEETTAVSDPHTNTHIKKNHRFACYYTVKSLYLIMNSWMKHHNHTCGSYIKGGPSLTYGYLSLSYHVSILTPGSKSASWSMF